MDVLEGQSDGCLFGFFRMGLQDNALVHDVPRFEYVF